MIPVVTNDLNIEFTTMPSLNYQMNIDDETIINKCDEIEAMKQVIYKILNPKSLTSPISFSTFSNLAFPESTTHKRLWYDYDEQDGKAHE